MSSAGTGSRSSAAPDLTTREGAAPFASTWRRKHLTVEQREARGRAARNAAPRSSHGRWEPAPRRPDPVALLEEQAASRVPQMVPIRYGRMLVSPFTFYRGAALIMATDLAATYRQLVQEISALNAREQVVLDELASRFNSHLAALQQPDAARKVKALLGVKGKLTKRPRAGASF